MDSSPNSSRVYIGTDALEFLAGDIDRSDAGASSHWRSMHRDFRYVNGEFRGLRGFGGYSPAPGWLRRSAHRMLQRPFRRIGHALGRFREADRAAASIVRSQDRTYDLDVLRQALTAALLLERMPSRLVPGSTAAVIGDGFGMLGTLLLTLAPGVRLVHVNLSRTLLVDLVFLSRALPTLKFALATNAGGLAALLADSSVRSIALRAEDASLLGRCRLDLAANVVSMQEMDPPIIAGYFKALREGDGPPVAFYCCNRVEKTLPDGTVVRFKDYPWSAGDDVLLDEPCPWNQRYYDWRPPFYHPYDGPIQHRLVLLSRNHPG